MCQTEKAIQDYIRRLNQGPYHDVQRAADAVNDLGDAFETIGGDLGALLPASALPTLMPKLQPLELKHNAAVAAIKAAKNACAAPNPFFKNDPGAIQPQEWAERVVMRSSIFCRMKLTGGATALSASLKGKYKGVGFLLFDKGESDDGTNWGWSESLTRYHTSLNKDGTLPDEQVFQCLGVSVDVQAADGGEMVPSDLRIIGDFFAYWTQNSGQTAIPLAHLERMPPLHRLEQSQGSDNAASVHFTGPAFAQSQPLFGLRSGDDKHALLVKVPDPTKKLSQDCIITVRLEGVLGVVPGGLS